MGVREGVCGGERMGREDGTRACMRRRVWGYETGGVRGCA